MPRGILKENLPQKVCIACNRPFTWRKKWERCWDEVKTCSKSCNAKRREAARPQDPAAEGTGASKVPQPKGPIVMGSPPEVMSRAATVEAATGRRRHLPDAARTRQVIAGGRRESPAHDDWAVLDDSDEEEEEAQGEGASRPMGFREVDLFDVELAAEDFERLLAHSGAPEASESDGPTATCAAADDGTLTENRQEGGHSLKGEDWGRSETGSETLALLGSREWRKAQRKAVKVQRRDQRAGAPGTEDVGRKACDMCSQRVDLLVRCTLDAAKQWHMVCGRCWRVASGGLTDGDADHPHYTYGGLWKNRARK